MSKGVKQVKRMSIVGLKVERVIDEEEVTVACETNKTHYALTTDGTSVSYHLSLDDADSFIKCEYEEVPPRVIQAFAEDLLEIAWDQAKKLRKEEDDEDEDNEDDEDSEDEEGEDEEEEDEDEDEDEDDD